MGDNVFNDNGSLNKEKVAEVIFRKDSLRRSLEDLLHPFVFERIKYFAKKRGKHDNILIIAAPLVYKRKYEDKFAKIIVVHTTEETALKRLGIKGVPKKDALLRMKAQLPITKKMKRADFLIDNNGTVKETKLQVEKLYRKLLREAKKWKSSEGSKT